MYFVRPREKEGKKGVKRLSLPEIRKRTSRRSSLYPLLKKREACRMVDFIIFTQTEKGKKSLPDCKPKPLLYAGEGVKDERQVHLYGRN